MKMIFSSLFPRWALLPVLLTSLPLAGGGIYEITLSLPPDSGTVEELPALWNGGKRKPSNVTLLRKRAGMMRSVSMSSPATNAGTPETEEIFSSGIF